MNNINIANLRLTYHNSIVDQNQNFETEYINLRPGGTSCKAARWTKGLICCLNVCLSRPVRLLFYNTYFRIVSISIVLPIILADIIPPINF